MSTVSIVFILGLFVSITQAELCARPQVHSQIVYIYRLKNVKTITIQNCFHIKSPTVTYSDITDNCLKALKSGVFVDKFNNSNNLVQQKGTKGYLVNYSAKADRIENKVFLKSGTVCRYDRGFCYDPKENYNYAAVWDVDFSPGAFTGNLIYQGSADIWSFKNNSLNYLFHEHKIKNEAFSFQLQRREKIRNITFWYTEKKFIVADGPLFGSELSPVNVNEMSLGTKSKVSEEILKSCDIQSLQFTQSELPVSEEYFTDPQNLITILRTYGHTISEINKQTGDCEAETKKILHNKIEHFIKELEIKINKEGDDIRNLQLDLLNHVNEFENFRKKLINFDPNVVEHSLKDKLNNDYIILHNKLDKLTKDYIEQDNINLNIYGDLKQLNESNKNFDRKFTEIFHMLLELKSKSDSNRQTTGVSSKNLKDLKSKLESELLKFSTKQDLILQMIEKTNNTNAYLNDKLIRLNTTIFEISYNISQYNSFSALQNKLENQINDLRNSVKNLETKYLYELRKQVQAENKILSEQFNLLNSRLTGNEKLTTDIEKELEFISQTVEDLQKANKKCNHSIVEIETRILEKLKHFENSYKTELKFMSDSKQQILSEIKNIHEIQTNFVKQGKTTNSLTIIYDTTNQELKNLSFSSEENYDHIEVILNNIKSLGDINTTLIQNTKNIALLFSRVELERENIESLNEAISKNTEDSKAFYEKVNKVERRQGNTEFTLNFHTNKITTLTNELRELTKNININKPTTAVKGQPTNFECDECSNNKFASIEQRFKALEKSLAKKDLEIDACHAELKELWKTKDEEIAKLREDIKKLKEDMQLTFIEANY